MSTAIYKANRVMILFGGVPISRGKGQSGFAEGDFVKIMQADDDFGTKTGTDGSVTRFDKATAITKVEIILMQSSKSNAVFSASLTKDKAGDNGEGVTTLVIQDMNGTSLYESDEAWVTGPPEVAFGQEPNARSWPLNAVGMNRIDGGN